MQLHTLVTTHTLTKSSGTNLSSTAASSLSSSVLSTCLTMVSSTRCTLATSQLTARQEGVGQWFSVYCAGEAAHFTQPHTNHKTFTDQDRNEMTGLLLLHWGAVALSQPHNTLLTNVRNVLRQFHKLLLEFPCHLRGKRAVLTKWQCHRSCLLTLPTAWCPFGGAQEKVCGRRRVRDHVWVWLWVWHGWCSCAVRVKRPTSPFACHVAAKCSKVTRATATR